MRETFALACSGPHPTRAVQTLNLKRLAAGCCQESGDVTKWPALTQLATALLRVAAYCAKLALSCLKAWRYGGSSRGLTHSGMLGPV